MPRWMRCRRPAIKAYRRLIEHPRPGAVLRCGESGRGAEPAEHGLAPGTAVRRNFAGSDLRAIPWVFAWTQNRHIVPGWYGFGSGIEAFIRERGGDEARTMLRRMFAQSRLFRLVIDEVEKTLLQVDLEIAEGYSRLVPDEDRYAARVFGMIVEEYEPDGEARAGRSPAPEELASRFPRFRRKPEAPE
jgi:phosphoenolpyruvate carboxylase